MLMGYSTKTSNYLEKIIVSYSTYIMSITDLVAIGIVTLKIDSECSSEKEFIELI